MPRAHHNSLESGPEDPASPARVVTLVAPAGEEAIEQTPDLADTITADATRSGRDPIFVDATGRRARIVRRAGWSITGLCAVYTTMLGLSFAGATPFAPDTLLPLPGVPNTSFRTLTDDGSGRLATDRTRRRTSDRPTGVDTGPSSGESGSLAAAADGLATEPAHPAVSATPAPRVPTPRPASAPATDPAPVKRPAPASPRPTPVPAPQPAEGTPEPSDTDTGQDTPGPSETEQQTPPPDPPPTDESSGKGSTTGDILDGDPLGDVLSDSDVLGYVITWSGSVLSLGMVAYRRPKARGRVG